MSALDPARPETWPTVLSLEDVAALYQTTPDAIRHALKPNRHRVCPYPHPFLRYPSRWRRSDVARHLRPDVYAGVR